MIAIAMSRVVRSPRDRVWRALTSLDEQIRWDTRLVSLEEPAPDYPKPGHIARWRCRLGSVAVDRIDEPLEVILAHRIRQNVKLGAFHFEETFTLEDGSDGDTRLSLRLASSNSVPIVGGELDRFGVRRLSTDWVNDSLAAIQRWCEDNP